MTINDAPTISKTHTSENIKARAIQTTVVLGSKVQGPSQPDPLLPLGE